MYGLFPGHDISVENTPEFAEAAKKTLAKRLSNGGGHTGWSQAWIINFRAQLQQGDEALDSIVKLFRHSTLPNLLDNHPPFQIDGNFGALAGIERLLVQSEFTTDGKVVVKLLPALPSEKAWQNGKVCGLCVKGGYSIDFSWENGKVVEYELINNGNGIDKEKVFVTEKKISTIRKDFMARKKKKNTKSSVKKIIRKILFVIALVLVCYYAYTYLVESGFFKNDFFPNVNNANTEEVFENESEGLKSSSEIKNEKTVEKSDVKKSEVKVSGEIESDYVENHPLFFGNPSDAIGDVNVPKNYLMEKPQFIISYNNEKLIPNWVGWHLGNEDLGEAERSDKFVPDETLPESWYQVRKEDYQFNMYGFDRGHVCPSADKTATSEDNEATFLMTNMIPQSPNCNRIVWMHLESYERELVEQGNELYIFAGPHGVGGTGSRGYFEEIVINKKDGDVYKISVPAYSWKVIMILSESDDDVNAISNNTEVIAVSVPNTQDCKFIKDTKEKADWHDYICSINDIEQMTGYDFFELLEDNLEETLESKIFSGF